MTFEFTFNPDTDDFYFDEPVGWRDADFQIIRDRLYHGISVLFGVTSLTFHDEAAQYLKMKYDNDRTAAVVEMRVRMICDPEPGAADVEIFDERFQLNFATYEFNCGTECSVEIAVEQRSCVQTFLNRFDQKVSADDVTAFDTVTPLDVYPGLNFPIMLPPKTVARLLDASVAAGGDGPYDVPVVKTDDFIFEVRPDYSIVRSNSIETGQPDGGFNYFLDDPGYNGAISPQILLESNIDCFPEGLTIDGRMKGRVKNITAPAPLTHRINVESLKVRVYYGVYGLTQTVLVDYLVPGSAGANLDVGQTMAFDHSFTIPATVIPNGAGIWATVEFIGHPTNQQNYVRFHVEFDDDTFITIAADQKCPPTRAEVCFPHELASHIVEAISDGCLKVRSEYYGRTDSMPFAYAEDGCGALRVLTSGLHIRRADAPTFFLSLKDFFDGMNPIDCIGYCIEDDPGGGQVVRIEDARYFYEDREILRCDAVESVKTKVDASELWSKIRVGFEKWEAEDTNSLDEFLSNREYRPNLENTKGDLVIMSKFIAAGYAIELCRRQSTAQTGSADTKFDNETFIIVVRRTACATLTDLSISNAGGANQFGMPANTPGVVIGQQFELHGSASNDGIFTVVGITPFFGGWLVEVSEPVTNEIIAAGSVQICSVGGVANLIEVEQGNIQFAGNMIDPPSVYNFRISPVRNLMRWFKIIGGSMPDAMNSGQLFFQAGTGNISARGLQLTTDCRIEGNQLAEKSSFTAADFETPADARPIKRPEIVSFEYPLSIAAFNALRANPYGFISWRCNTDDDFQKGYLMNIRYKLAAQMASFELRTKY